MKIGITTFGGDGGRSGISRYIIQLLAAMADTPGPEEYEVVVYEDEHDLFLPANGRMKGLAFPRKLRPPLRNVAWHQLALPRLCRQRGWDALFLPAANRRLPLSAPCPTAGTVHDFSSLHVAGKYDRARMFYITRVLPMLIRRLTRVITISESSKADIIAYGRVPEARVTVIAEAADPAVYFPRDADAAQRLAAEKYGARAPFLLYVSRIEHPGKNHARLIRAFARVKAETKLPHALVLAGGDWTRAAEVHREAAACACPASILFTGFADNADLPWLYSAAEAFVFPSLYEGFGLPLLEAMSCGAPTACANLSSLPEVAGDASLLFDPYDEDAIAAALRSLMTQPELRADYRRRGFARAAEFSWARAARETIAVLRTMDGRSEVRGQRSGTATTNNG